MRIGLILEKIGMSSLFDDKGAMTPVTLLKMHDTNILAHRTKEKNGYDAVVLGTVNTRADRVSKSIQHLFARANAQSKKIIREFRVDAFDNVDVGSSLSVAHFQAGQFLDVTGISIGKGFAGGMKRHNFRGLEASHGVSVSHRSHGSTGGRQDPGRVFKNKKMAGHMGCEKVTIQNLQVLVVDSEKQLLIVKGAVPGSRGSFVTVKDALKK